jgi:hypothetical protein
VLGTTLHPAQADPNDPVAAFSEYAADQHWVASHLLQLAGAALIVLALLVVAEHLRSRTGWARVAAGGAIATLALSAALQAVDGIALKVMVDTWAAAAASEQPALFHSAFAVRQVEIGFASMVQLSFGLTAIAYGAALVVHRTRWLGALAFIGGVPSLTAGVLTAYTGFSGRAMAVSMPATVVLLAWMLALGVHLWRGDPPSDSGTNRP